MMSKVCIAGILVLGCSPVSSYSLTRFGNNSHANEYEFGDDSQTFNQTSPGRGGNMIKESKDRHEFMLLNEQDIRSELSGKTISPDFSIPQASLDFMEQFLFDGTWLSVRKMRGPVQIQGHWYVKDNKICVEKENERPKCRSVWKSRSSGHLYITDLGASPPFDKKIRVIAK